jgi:Immunoglobulin I-set domain
MKKESVFSRCNFACQSSGSEVRVGLAWQVSHSAVPLCLALLSTISHPLSTAFAQTDSYTNWNSLVTNWVQTSAPSGVWVSIASSGDGTQLGAAAFDGGIYDSTNSGLTWSQTNGLGVYWYSITSSADGTKLAAVDDGGGIYTSTNSGLTWTQSSAPDENWWPITSSADGTKLAAGVYYGGIYTSTNSGLTWTQSTAPSAYYWRSIASSADGTKLAAVMYDGWIYTSTNAGSTWLSASVYEEWGSVASSADGTKLAAVVIGGGIYASTNSGLAWTQTSAPSETWESIASSADGTKLAAAFDGGIYTSTNSGLTWTQTSAPSQWYSSIASSADGTKLAAVVNGGGIWTAQATITTALVITNKIPSTTVSSGGSVTLTVGVSGAPPFTYQWFRDGSALTGATNATLIIRNFGSTNVGTYTVTVNNAVGSVTSLPAILASVDLEMIARRASVAVNGPLGSNYLIQATSVLMTNNWTTLTNVLLSSQPYIFIDYNSATNRQQFYRAVPVL